MSAHLVVDVSGHGLGHLAQAAPVAHALQARIPGLRITVRGEIPVARVRARIPGCRPLSHHLDVGMAMASSLDVLPEASLRAYQAFHADWPQRVLREARMLEALAPDLLLADVPYASLAAAAHAGIPAAALCSLHWGDIFDAYCGRLPGAGSIHAEILAAYRQVPLFLQPAPHMPMPDLPGRRSIGPVAHTGTGRRRELRARLGLAGDTLLGVLAMGGLAFEVPLERWPRRDDLHWLASLPGPLPPGFTPLDTLDVPFLEVLAASDVVLTKPGYGTFAEAACHGVPVVYVSRRDWPEEPYLEAWLAAHGRGVEVPRTALTTGEAAEAACALARGPRPRPVAPTGVAEAAEILARLLGAA